MMNDVTPQAAKLGFPQRILNAGFVTALCLAGVCLLSGVAYLVLFLTSTQNSINELMQPRDTATVVSFSVTELAMNARMVMARVALISCGIFVGMSFGFLGFALFLIGVQGEMDAELKHERVELKLFRIAPGALVLLCAALLIGLCVTRETPFSSRRGAVSGEEETTVNGRRPTMPSTLTNEAPR